MKRPPFPARRVAEFYATLVALAAPVLDNVRAIAVGVTAGVVTLMLAPVPYQGGMFVAILTGITVGVLSERWFSTD